MAIKIGHASKDENGKITGGAAGDQTGKEVCSRNWFSMPWTAVIRPKDAAAAEKIAKAMEQACANDNIGYDQGQRTTLYARAKEAGWDLSRIAEKCECDCSALVAVCVNAAGIAVSKDIYTGNQKTALGNTGAFEVLTASKYIGSSTYLKRGDILLGNGHTAIVLSDGSAADTTTTTITAKKDYTVGMRTMKKGCAGEDVKALQILLIGRGYDCGKYGADGDFGSATDKAVRAYQKNKGLTVDGIAGKDTMTSLLGMG